MTGTDLDYHVTATRQCHSKAPALPLAAVTESHMLVGKPPFEQTPFLCANSLILPRCTCCAIWMSGTERGCARELCDVSRKEA
eukprot:1642036-Rhodomonas_salina.3